MTRCECNIGWLRHSRQEVSLVVGVDWFHSRTMRAHVWTIYLLLVVFTLMVWKEDRP